MAAREGEAAAAAMDLLQGVHPGWLRFFARRGLEPALLRALDAVGATSEAAAELPPPPALIFEAFRYFPPEATRVIILGQDPYPNDAMGLAFSVAPGADLKPSLAPIFANLARHGLALPPAGRPNGDLRPWAIQGVLLLNMALTTRKGARLAHASVWKAFVGGVLYGLTGGLPPEPHPPCPVTMAWGGQAQTLAQAFAMRGTLLLQWSHPSPMANNALPPARKFENSPHFKAAREELLRREGRGIEWDIAGTARGYCDGATARNGKEDAEGAFGVFIITGPLKGLELSGRVARHPYALVDPADPFKGFAPLFGRPGVPPTNNRSEYLAGAWLLLLLLRARGRGGARMVSDSKLLVHTLNLWLPARRRAGTAGELKNLDLVEILEALLAALRKEARGATLAHIHSHQPRPPAGTPLVERADWYGNRRSDLLAGAALAPIGSPPAHGSVELGGPMGEKMRWALVDKWVLDR